MKKLAAILITILMLLPASACKKAPPEDIGSVSIDTPAPMKTSVPVGYTQAPYQDTTDEPTEAPSEAPSDEPTGSPSEAPTEAPTEVPTAVPTEIPYIPRSVEEAVELYETHPMECPVLDRSREKPNHTIEEPRYKQGEDGIWRASSPEGDEAVIMLTGDLMCQTRQQEAAKTDKGYDFEDSFYYVKKVFTEADFVIGNLESMSTETLPYMHEQTFVEDQAHLNAPATFIEAVRRAGYDMVVMSNNHNCDTGVRGVYDTLDRVDEYRLIHTGMYRNAAEQRWQVVCIKGINVGFISYATYFNTKDRHFTKEGLGILLSPYSKEIAERDIAAARAAGAEFVIVYMHWGIEYVNIPSEQVMTWAQEVADAGADYIIGSHPHALQPYDRLTSCDGRSVPIIYSMGNFLSHQNDIATKDTIILRLKLARDRNGKVIIADEGYIPCYVFPSFKGRLFVIVPVVSPYSDGTSSMTFPQAHERITLIMGPKIKALGELKEPRTLHG